LLRARACGCQFAPAKVERALPAGFDCGMQLDAPAKMKLLEFVCSFAWTDLKVQQKERDLVMRIAGRFQLSAAQIRQVEAWLAKPPRADEIDPAEVPKAHRQMFLDAAFLTVSADGKVVPAERDQLAVFADLLAD
jgi:hypothetical protein